LGNIWVVEIYSFNCVLLAEIINMYTMYIS